MKTEKLTYDYKRTVKLTYQILAKDIVATQKTFTRTVSNNCNAYNEFEEKAREYFDRYEVKFNHPGRLIILSYKEQYQ